MPRKLSGKAKVAVRTKERETSDEDKETSATPTTPNRSNSSATSTFSSPHSSIYSPHHLSRPYAQVNTHRIPFAKPHCLCTQRQPIFQIISETIEIQCLQENTGIHSTSKMADLNVICHCDGDFMCKKTPSCRLAYWNQPTLSAPEQLYCRVVY